MKILMLHDIRDFDENFFPKRYELPYFLNNSQFDNILNNLRISKSKILEIDDEINININTYKDDIVILTFDDGLKDHLSVARNLASKKIKGCFFIPSGPILEKSIIDSHKIQFVLASASPIKIVDYIKKEFELYFNISSDELNYYYQSRWKNNIWPKEMVFVTRMLREYKDSKWKRIILNQIFSKYVTKDHEDFSSQFYLNKDNVNEIKSLGHHIGGHGHYSYDLKFEDLHTINDELNSMNKFLTDLNIDKKVYAYANGGFNNYVKEKISDLGFQLAFTTANSKLKNFKNKLELPRIDPSKTKLILK